jgi:ABC-type transporter Mla subunit MlaD
VEEIAIQMQNQGQQVQQQSYQIFALSETLQTLIDGQTDSKYRLDKLVNSLQELVGEIKHNS